MVLDKAEVLQVGAELRSVESKWAVNRCYAVTCCAEGGMSVQYNTKCNL